jgi:hypothetical protein
VNHRVLGYISAFVLLSAAIVMIAYFYLLFTPLKPVLEVGEISLYTPTVRAGENIVFTAYTCKNAALPASVARRLENNIIITMPNVQTNISTGCKTERFAITVPTEVPPGHYTFHATFIYQPSFTHSLSYDLVTPEFEVIR